MASELNRSSVATDSHTGDIFSVRLNEIGKCVGFCARGRPLDLWQLKRSPAGDSKNDNTQRAEYAAPLVASLYTFCTGNADLRTPSRTFWNKELGLDTCGKQEAFLARRVVGEDAHEPHLRNGWVLLCSESKGMQEVGMHPDYEAYAAAHFLIACSERPVSSYCDIVSVAFNSSNQYFDYTDPFELLTPLSRNVFITRVYHSEKLCKLITARVRQFNSLRSEEHAKSWMLERPGTADLHAKIEPHLRVAKPHTFLCNGEYQDFAKWRSCLLTAIRMHKSRSQRSAKQKERDAELLSAAEKLFDRRSRSLGKPYLYLQRDVSAPDAKRRRTTPE